MYKNNGKTIRLSHIPFYWEDKHSTTYAITMTVKWLNQKVYCLWPKKKNQAVYGKSIGNFANRLSIQSIQTAGTTGA